MEQNSETPIMATVDFEQPSLMSKMEGIINHTDFKYCLPRKQSDAFGVVYRCVLFVSMLIFLMYRILLTQTISL
jgi:hypothetical protein